MLFLLVLVPPTVTLVWLGTQLLEQDRNLVKERDLERRQAAADNIARSLAEWLLEEGNRPAVSTASNGILRLSISSAGTRIDPPGRALWLPNLAPPAAGDAPVFTDAESLELQGTGQRALIRYEELSRSTQPAIRAGALLHLARVYRTAGRASEAAEAYRRLAAIPGVALYDVPADLLARRAVCSLLDESGRKADLARAAAALETDFLAGRWMLDRPGWELTAQEIEAWTGRALAVSPERKALSEAADWIWEESRLLESSGWRVISADVPVTVLWRVDGARIAGVAIAPSAVRARLDVAAPGVGRRVALVADSGQVFMGETPAARAGTVRRTTAETGLPWTLILGPGDMAEQSQDLALRRRLLSLGLGAILLLLAGGSFLLWRVVERELAVARLQTDFVSAVSHEFRTPLTSLRHAIELLEEDDDLPRERRQTFYGALGRSTERLHRLVESLLDFGRMEVGRKPYDLQKAHAGEIAAQVVADFQKETVAQGFTIHLQVDSSANLGLRADAGALAHALWNLLDNAVKYSPQESEVWVSVYEHAEGVAIAVEDHGLGIPRREQKEIFHKFVRGGKARQLGIKGTGLGLAIVSHIVHAHGGAIELESEEGNGSTFRLVLPREV